MAPKKKQPKKPCDCKKYKGVIYIQASNPDKKLYDFMGEMTEYGHIVYFQTGKPCGGPGQPTCQ